MSGGSNAFLIQGSDTSDQDNLYGPNTVKME